MKTATIINLIQVKRSTFLPSNNKKNRKFSDGFREI